MKLTAEWNDNYLKVIVPDILPHHDRLHPLSKAAHIEYVNRWKTYIVGAYKQLGVKVNYTKAFCLIITYHKNGGPWDLDNRNYKYILDGLRAAHIIPDDSFKHLSYMVDGCSDKKFPRTEIYVLNFDILSNLYKFLGIVKRV